MNSGCGITPTPVKSSCGGNGYGRTKPVTPSRGCGGGMRSCG